MEQTCKVCGGYHSTGACTQNHNPKDIQTAAYNWVATSGLEPDEIVEFLSKFEKYSTEDDSEKDDDSDIPKNKNPRYTGFKKDYTNQDFRVLCDILKSHPKIRPLLETETKKESERPTNEDSELSPSEQKKVAAFQPSSGEIEKALTFLTNACNEVGLPAPDESMVEQAAKIIGALGEERIPLTKDGKPNKIWLLTESYINTGKNPSSIYETTFSSLLG